MTFVAEQWIIIRSILLISHRFLKVTQISQITQILICAVLDGEGAENGAGDGDKVLGYLNDFVPIDFHFTQNNIERNTFN